VVFAGGTGHRKFLILGWDQVLATNSGDNNNQEVTVPSLGLRFGPVLWRFRPRKSKEQDARKIRKQKMSDEDGRSRLSHSLEGYATSVPLSQLLSGCEKRAGISGPPEH
jgi:hypothetical protein